MNPGLQQPVFPGGHPSKYSPRPALINISERVTELALVAIIDLLLLINVVFSLS